MSQLFDAVTRLRQAATPYPHERGDKPGGVPARTRVVRRDDIALVLAHIDNVIADDRK